MVVFRLIDRYTVAMNTDLERLNFVLQLAKMNLDTLREGDKLNVRDDVIAFLEWPPHVDASRWLQQNLDLSHIREMQDDTRYILQGLAAGLLWFKNKGEPDLQHWKAIPREIPKGLFLISSTDASNGQPLRHRALVDVTGTIALDFLEPGSLQANLIGSPDIRTAFRLKLVSAFAAVGVPALRLCPECSLVFVAEHGKRQFCSDRCKGRVTDREYRRGHRKELRDKAHARYEKKVKAKLGPLQKVGQFHKAKTAKEKS